jgi:NAD(P)-dependent dehydrogenase (short-subunit alcohol dehydrogenase family)
LDETARLSGAGALSLSADVSVPADVDRVIQETLARFGRLDAVVHCAGLAPAVPIAEMSVEQWKNVLDTNLSAAFYLLRAVWPAFVRQGGGVMVNVSSPAARDPFPAGGTPTIHRWPQLFGGGDSKTRRAREQRPDRSRSESRRHLSDACPPDIMQWRLTPPGGRRG